MTMRLDLRYLTLSATDEELDAIGRRCAALIESRSPVVLSGSFERLAHRLRLAKCLRAEAKKRGASP